MLQGKRFEETGKSSDEVPGPGSYEKVHKSDIKFESTSQKKPRKNIGALAAASIQSSMERNIGADQEFVTRAQQDMMIKHQSLESS